MNKVEAEFTVEEFKTWLATKDPDERYDYCSNGNCCVAQFLKETGRAKKPFVHPCEYYKTQPPKGLSRTSPAYDIWLADTESFDIPEVMQDALHAGTFGGVLDRIEVEEENA